MDDNVVTPYSKLVFDNLTELVACTVAGYPIYLARTLMQLGYEPLKPVNGRYPSIVGYLRFIKNEKGFTAMYTGLPYHLSYVFAQKITYSSLDLLTRGDNKPGRTENNDDHDDDDDSSNNLIHQAMRESALKIHTTIITYPIFTLGISYITSYFFNIKAPIELTFKDLYGGIMPKLIVEVATVWAVKISWRLTTKYFGNRAPIEKQIISRAPPLVLSSILYPLNVVSTVMADGGRSRTNVKYDDWQQCYYHLKNMSALRRGSSLVWRYDREPKIKEFYLNQ